MSITRSNTNSSIAVAVAQLQSVYHVISSDNVELLASVYTNDVRFVDPFGEISGLPMLERYFASMYDQVIACEFDFGEADYSHSQAWLPWVMQLRHRRINNGELIVVEGVSLLRGDAKIYFHRDYFDAGALLYEHLPLLGLGIRWLKQRVHRQ